MQAEIQKASVWKRMAAWILDGILLIVLTTGAMLLLSYIFNYDKYSTQLDAVYTSYEQKHNVSFDITEQDYDAMTEEERANWNKAYDELIADEEALRLYNLSSNLILLMITLGILAANLILHVVVPLLLKHGRTIGKIAMGLGVIRQDGVKMNTLQLFVRSLLGKFTLETMIPVYIVMLIIQGSIGILGTAFLFIMLIGQLVCMGVTRNNATLHDLLAGTAVVDLASQKVFQSSEELMEYIKQEHAERAARQEY